MALPYTIDHLTLFSGPTAFILTVHLSAFWVAFTPLTTRVISPECLPCRNVSTLMGTAAVINTHTLVPTQHKAFVADATLNTGPFAFGGSITVRTCGWTGTGTKFIVAVGRTF